MNLLSGLKILFSPKWLVETFFTTWGGDGGGGSAPTQQTVQQSNIPEYAQPYVERMLNATENQIYTSDGALQPYQPYSTNMQDYVAGFSPLQRSAQSQAAGLTLPGQIGMGTSLAGTAGLGSLGVAGQAMNAGQQYNAMATNPYATQAFMNPYLQASLAPQLAEAQRQYGITGAQEQAQATAAGAFGGSREALMAAENQRNKNTAMNQLIAQGYNNAFQQAQQAQQFGANLGLQGQQTALTGLGQAGQLAGTLGQLGQTQLSAQQGIIGTQAAQGAQQQAQQQQMINQAIQNYATAQQYPLMELGTLSNMLRGLPMQASTTQQYQATANPLVSGIGMAGTLASLGGYSQAGKAEGGLASIKSMKVGGVTESIESKLYDMEPEDLLKESQNSESDTIKKLAKRIYNEKTMASGGIVAFKDGDVVDADEERSPLSRMLDWSRNIKESDFGKKVAARRELENKINELTPGVFTGPKLWNAEKQSDYDARQAKLNELKAAYSDASVPAAPVNQSVNQVSSQDVGSNMNPMQYDYMNPTAALADATGKGLPSNIVQPKEAAPAAQAVPTNKNAPAGPSVSGLPPVLQEAMNDKRTAEQIKKDARDAYTKEVINGPMTPEGKELYNSYKDKINESRTKEEQMMWMHSAMFFAKLGTTPGPFAFAALSALKDELPNYVKDKTDLEKYNDQLNKSMYELSNAELLKRQGLYKAGEDAQKDAIKNTSEAFKEVVDAKYKQQMGGAAEKTAEAHMITAEAASTKTGGLDLKQQEAIDKHIKDNFTDADKVRLSLLETKVATGKATSQDIAGLNVLKSKKDQLLREAYARFAPGVVPPASAAGASPTVEPGTVKTVNGVNYKFDGKGWLPA